MFVIDKCGNSISRLPIFQLDRGIETILFAKRHQYVGEFPPRIG